MHISFVRSISMDAFKVVEIARMDKGGNTAWRTFFDEHDLTRTAGVSWDSCSIPDRYGGDVGEEWKERLTALVEGREYVPTERKEKGPGTRSGAGPSSIRSSSPGSTAGGAEDRHTRKAQNEAFFAGLGAANAARPGDLPPSQGGKYAGFGSDPSCASSNGGGPGADPALPSMDDFQQDPVKALTKGFGWFSTAVGKSAKTVNEGWIQPAAQKVGFSSSSQCYPKPISSIR